MKRIYTKFRHAFRGLGYTLRADRGVQLLLLVGTTGLVAAHYFFGPFTDIGNLLLVFCFFFVLITELQNSALETTLDRVHPEQHPEIGLSKDIASASVLCAAVFSLVCAYYVATGRI